jgi:tRNA C32,U32 (ribose-2'-O)-methylase TrmJ
LNLAQAVSIILYSLHILKDDLPETDYREAKKEEKDMLIEWFGKAVAVSGIKDWKADHLVRRFRNIIGRAFVSGKEAHSLVGVFSRTYNRLKELDNEQ